MYNDRFLKAITALVIQKTFPAETSLFYRHNPNDNGHMLHWNFCVDFQPVNFTTHHQTNYSINFVIDIRLVNGEAVYVSGQRV